MMIKKSVIKSFDELKRNYELVTMTGDQLYEKYGIHRSETLWEMSQDFPNGYCMEIKAISGEGNEKAALSVLLLDSAGNLLCDCSEDYNDDFVVGRFIAEDPTICGACYEIEIKLKPCAVALRCEGHDSYVAYIESDWLQQYLSNGSAENSLFHFLEEYTSEDTMSVFENAVLAGKVAMVEHTDDGTVEVAEQYSWIADAVKQRQASRQRYLNAMQCLVDNGIERSEAYTVLEALVAILNDSDVSDVLDAESVDLFEKA